MEQIEIDQTILGQGHPPWCIAEMSCNHDGSLERALDILNAVASCGAHACKIQVYTPEMMTFKSRDPAYLHGQGSLWTQYSLHDVYTRGQTPLEWLPSLFAHAKSLGLTLFPSVFTPESVALIETYDPPCYKIASLELIDHGLLQAVAQTQKPVFLSTGCASLQEIQEAVDLFLQYNNRRYILMKCTSGYPTPIQESNLRSIEDLRTRFGGLIGLSDHTTDHLTSILATGLGVCAIEKHFTLSHDLETLDEAFSLDPQEFRTLVEETKRAHMACGVVHYGPTLHQSDSFRFRRSLFFVRDVLEGQVISEGDIRSLRPSIGMAPKYLPQLVGKRVCRDVYAGEPVTQEVILS